MIRSSVDLPEPEGPRKAMNSRDSSVSETSSRTGVEPKLFWMPRRSRLATRTPLPRGNLQQARVAARSGGDGGIRTLGTGIPRTAV